MAASRPLRPSVRRRRIAALVVLVCVVATAAAVTVDALRHGGSAPQAVAPPPQRTFRIIFPEGFTRAQMAARVTAVAAIARRESGKPVALNARAYLAASLHAVVPCVGKTPYRDLEGFLFPATYDFVAQTPTRTLVADQLQAFCARLRTVNLAYARAHGLTPYDVVIIASMIEREAGVASDRRLISAVIYNRLRDGMQLGIDATLRYGLHLAPEAPITAAELASQNAYNTRVHYGLPPTPIANPGLASLEAAAHPARVDYLYFALRPGTRRSYFTASQSAFDAFLASHGYK